MSSVSMRGPARALASTSSTSTSINNLNKEHDDDDNDADEIAQRRNARMHMLKDAASEHKEKLLKRYKGVLRPDTADQEENRNRGGHHEEGTNPLQMQQNRKKGHIPRFAETHDDTHGAILKAGTLLPSMGGASSALHAEAQRLSDPRVAILPAVAADAAATQARNADCRWRALLSLFKLERHNKNHIVHHKDGWRNGFPSMRQFLYVADEFAPDGKLSHAAFEIVLSRVYGFEISKQWASSPSLTLLGKDTTTTTSSGRGGGGATHIWNANIKPVLYEAAQAGESSAARNNNISSSSSNGGSSVSVSSSAGPASQALLSPYQPLLAPSPPPSLVRPPIASNTTTTTETFSSQQQYLNNAMAAATSNQSTSYTDAYSSPPLYNSASGNAVLLALSRGKNNDIGIAATSAPQTSSATLLSTLPTLFGPIPALSPAGKAALIASSKGVANPLPLPLPTSNKTKRGDGGGGAGTRGGGVPKFGFSPIAAAKALAANEYQEDEMGHLIVGIDPRTGLRGLAPPQEANFSQTLRMDDAALIGYLARGGRPNVDSFLKAMQAKKENDAVLQAALEREGKREGDGVKLLYSASQAKGQQQQQQQPQQQHLQDASGSTPTTTAATTSSSLKAKQDQKSMKTGRKARLAELNPYASPADAHSALWERPTPTPAFLVELTALWRDLWRGFTWPIDEIGTVAFDTRLLAAAWAMLPLFRKEQDPRFIIKEALRTLSLYDGDGCVTRSNFQAVLCIPIRAAKDCTRVADAAVNSFIQGMTTGHGTGYKALDARIPLDQLLSRVLAHRGLDTVLGPHPSSAPRLPITYYELLTASPLRGWIIKRKRKRANILAAADFLNFRLLRRVFRLLAFHSRIEKQKRHAMSNLIALAASHDETRRTEAFYIWRRKTIRLRAIQRLQSFCRMVVARGEMRRQSARLYLSAQLRMLWKYKLAMRYIQRSRSRHNKVMFRIKKMFQSFRARKLRTQKELLVRQQAKLDAEALMAHANMKVFLANTIRIQHWWQQIQRRKLLFYRIRVLKERALHERRELVGRELVEAEINLKRAKRKKVDQTLLHMRKAAERARKLRKQGLFGDAGGDGDADGGGGGGGETTAARAGMVEIGKAKKQKQSELTPSYLKNIGVLRAQTKAISAVSAMQGNAAAAAAAISSSLHTQEQTASAAATAGVTTNNITLIPTIAPIRLSVRQAKSILARTLVKVAARARMRKMLIGRVERRYILKTGEYEYWDVRDNVKWGGDQSGTRPFLLGARHELAVPDVWEVHWDPRAPEMPYFFNLRYHAVSWEQPEGTILCKHCDRSFVDMWCATCRKPWCSACLGVTHDTLSSSKASKGTSGGEGGQNGEKGAGDAIVGGAKRTKGKGNALGAALQRRLLMEEESRKAAEELALAHELANKHKLRGHKLSFLRGGFESSEQELRKLTFGERVGNRAAHKQVQKMNIQLQQQQQQFQQFQQQQQGVRDLNAEYQQQLYQQQQYQQFYASFAQQQPHYQQHNQAAYYNYGNGSGYAVGAGAGMINTSYQHNRG